MKVDDRRLAATVHVASIFFPFLAPVIGWAAFRKRRPYVECHSISALLDELVLKLLFLLVGIASLTMTIINVTNHIQKNGLTFSWDLVFAAIIKMAVLWAVFSLVGLVVTIRSVMQAISAYNGHLPKSRIAKRIAMGPATNSLPPS